MGPGSLWHKIQLGHERDLVRSHEVLIQQDLKIRITSVDMTLNSDGVT